MAGLAASQHLASEYKLPTVVATDMGGTSFDIGILEAGGPWIYDFQPVIDRWRVATPMVYLRTLGAGGGSIARYDRLWRTVEVGPDSAGSDPGPACYGRGGTLPTVTDADLILGYLNPDYYASGNLRLEPELAELAIEEHISGELGDVAGAGGAADQEQGRREDGRRRSSRKFRPADSIRAKRCWFPTAAPGRCIAADSRRSWAFTGL